MLALLAFAELFVMTLWFSASAVVPELTEMWGLTGTEAAWLTISVQFGFVAGALLLSIFTLADVIRPKYLFAGSAFVGAAVTVIIAAFVDSLLPALILRFITGMTLAGVYPVGMKMMAQWFDAGRGMAIGVLVGALTVGSAAPHLFRAIGGIGRPPIVLNATAIIAAIGGLIILGYEPGPHQPTTAPFDPSAIMRIVRDRGTILANLGYFGHMWELYTVWTWIPLYLIASFSVGGVKNPSEMGSLLSFGMISAGGFGAWWAGSAADRWGRTDVTSASMIISGLSCIVAGFMFGASLWVIVPFILIWGFAIVADSAQFSTAVSELAEPGYVGSALTLQTAIGYLLTVISIQLLPVFERFLGWQWAFAPFAIGPAIGTAAMLYLRTLPEANQLAVGKG